MRVASGILSSRVLGVVREVVVASVFGAGGRADVFATALRGPNLLQNLLGEQTLSASFIPVYSRLLEEGREEEAGRFAGAVFGLLLAVAAGLTLAGILLAGPLVALLAPGFLTDAARVAAGAATVDRYPLAVAAVRVIFPMAGVLVLSAWTLGVLNSHRRFFLPYFAPVLWNAAIITALLAAAYGFAPVGKLGPGGLDRVVLVGCWGALVGGLLQFLVQVPLAARLLRGFRLSLSTRVGGVREALRAFLPLVAARGVLQLSSYLDLVLASLLAAGAVATLRWASVFYLLPVSLFAMSVAAAELPELARRQLDAGTEGLAERARAALRRIAFPVAAAAVGYLAFGFLIVGGLFRRGSFGLTDQWLVYLALCGFTLGLPAAAWSRLLQNVFYAVGETRVPARIAVVRVATSASLGAALMLVLDRYPVSALVGVAAPGKELYLGAVGLALGGGSSAWVELTLLRRALRPWLPGLRLPLAGASAMIGGAIGAALPAAGIWLLLAPRLALLPTAAAVVVSYASLYLLVARGLRWPEVRVWLGRFGGS